MKKIYITTIIACIMTITLHAQNDESHEFLNEIGINYGTTFADIEGSSISLDAAHFFTTNIGVRTGLTYYSDMPNTAWAAKLPVLIAFRTSNSSTSDYDPMHSSNYDNSLGEDIFNTILSFIPLRMEANIGPTFGYLGPDSNSKYKSEFDKKKSEDYYLNSKILVTIDANVRASIVISHVIINASIGASFIATRNYKYFTKDDYDNESIARWMANFSIGASYQF